MNNIRCAQELIKIAKALIAEDSTQDKPKEETPKEETPKEEKKEEPKKETPKEDLKEEEPKDAKFNKALDEALGDKAKKLSDKDRAKLFDSLSKKGHLEDDKFDKTIETIKKKLG